jgi:hypothetical protein
VLGAGVRQPLVDLRRLESRAVPGCLEEAAPAENTVTSSLAGHFRIGPDGIEFATGYLDQVLPKSVVAAAATRSVSPSRSWMHVVATGKDVVPFQITACTCGEPRRFLPPDLRLRLE